MKRWYEDLFQDYAQTYDREFFTGGTIAEVDFIEQEIGCGSGKSVLDVGCGTGRHAIELARRGFRVTGLDLSASQLHMARKKAVSCGVQINLIRQDARSFAFKSPFDAVIMLCEGAFPLMETDEMNYMILERVSAAIKPRGKFIFTTLNALYPLYHSTEQFINQENSNLLSRDHRFDLLTFRDHSTITVKNDFGREKILQCNERYYAPSEITWLLRSLDFENISIYGCDTGLYSRRFALRADHFEMLVVSDKKEDQPV